MHALLVVVWSFIIGMFVQEYTYNLYNLYVNICTSLVWIQHI